MALGTKPSLKRRRMPTQGRSIVTVDAIFEATIQVLTVSGPLKLNTTRVASRAGVSVGTLYQYFPNKQFLLLALLERQLLKLTNALEKACNDHVNEKIENISYVIVNAYFNAIMSYSEVSPALYYVATELNAGVMLDCSMNRSICIIEKMLSNCIDSYFDDVNIISHTLSAVLYGTVPVFCKRIMSVDTEHEAKKLFELMIRSYLLAHKREM